MKFLKVDHNSVISSLDLDFTNDINEADAVITWNDVLPVERTIIDYARKLGKKVYVFQHGRRGSSKYYPPFNEKIYADKMFVWGENDKARLLKAGQDESKIVVAGSPIFKFLKPRLKPEYIVFCPEHWDRPVDENYQVRDELRKLKEKVVSKIIDCHNPAEFDNPVQTSTREEGHLEKCVEVLQKAKMVVSITEGTFELLAQAMDIPVIIMNEWEPKAFGGNIKYTEYERIISPASKQTSLKNLLKTIKTNKQDDLKKERKDIIIKDGGFGLDPNKIIYETNN